jgi:hypothetical protein
VAFDPLEGPAKTLDVFEPGIGCHHFDRQIGFEQAARGGVDAHPQQELIRSDAGVFEKFGAESAVAEFQASGGPGTVTFGGLSIANIDGLNNSVALGRYTLIGGDATFNFTNVSNFGAANQADLGGGKFAYFESGSLQVEVVPEPTTWALLAYSLTTVMVLRRRRTA